MPPFQHPEHNIQLPDGGVMALGRQATVMGILNVTPDSFSDGGEYRTVRSALAHARRMIAEGADIIDVGGESTRPGADPVTVSDELSRVIPVIEALRSEAIARPVSIDTTKAEVAARAVQAGASIINDVSGLNNDREIAAVAVQYDVPLILMHWDKDRDTDRDIIGEIKRYFGRAVEVAEAAGVGKNRIILDPGFGFAKSLAENYQILREFSALHGLGYPLVTGTSRKSMIGKLLDASPSERVAGTIATTVIAYCAGAHIFRVHDVRANRDALRVAEAALYGIQT